MPNSVTLHLYIVEKNGKIVNDIYYADADTPIQLVLNRYRLTYNCTIYDGTKLVWTSQEIDKKPNVKALMGGLETRFLTVIDVTSKIYKSIDEWDKGLSEMKKVVKVGHGHRYFTVVFNGIALKARISLLPWNILNEPAAKLCGIQKTRNFPYNPQEFFSKVDGVQIQIGRYKMGGFQVLTGEPYVIRDDCDLALGSNFLAAYNATYSFKTGQLTINDTVVVVAEKDTMFDKAVDYEKFYRETNKKTMNSRNYIKSKQKFLDAHRY